VKTAQLLTVLCVLSTCAAVAQAQNTNGTDPVTGLRPGVHPRVRPAKVGWPTLGLPQLLPTSQPGQPSLLQRVRNSTLSTYRALTPWNAPGGLPAPPPVTGTRRVYSGSALDSTRPQSNRSHAEREYSSLWNNKLEPERVDNPITDFLNSPRVK